MDKLETLQRTLSAYKGHFTRASNDVEKLLKTPTQDQTEIAAKTKVLERQWTRFDEAYTALETSLLDIKDTEKEIETLQDEYYPLFSLYEHYIAKLKALETKKYQDRVLPVMYNPTRFQSCLNSQV